MNRPSTPCRQATQGRLVEGPYRHDPQGGDGLRWRIKFVLCGVKFESELLTEARAKAAVADMAAAPGEGSTCAACPVCVQSKR